MTEEFESYKGIHPGKVIERLLTKGNIDKREFALKLSIHLRTFNLILKAEKSLNIALGLKVERALCLEEGSLMVLQVYHDLKQKRVRTQGPGPDLMKGLFWDVHFSKIDWELSWHFVVERVYQRGDKKERDEVDRFYGLEKVNQVLRDRPRTPSGSLVLMQDLAKRFEEMQRRQKDKS